MFHHDPEIVEKLKVLAHAHGLSLEAGYMMFKAALISEFDPLNGGTGKEFKFPVREAPRVPLEVKDLFPVLGPVPPPDAKCDVFGAFKQWQIDQRACEQILNSHPDFEVNVSVIKNQTDWLSFWMDRGFNEEFRRKAKEALIGWQEAIGQVLRRAA
jgi:hypothetical protein